MVEGNKQLAIFNDAFSEGAISADTLARVNDRQIQNALTLASGHPASEEPGNKVLLVTILVDNSGSMRHNVNGVITGHSRVLDILSKNPNAHGIWVSTQFLLPDDIFRRAVLSPYGPLLDSNGEIITKRLTKENYQATGSYTPLYRRSEEVLLSVLGKAAEFRGEWKEATTATLLMTDGYDEGTGDTPDKVAKVVIDLKRARTHLIAAMGFGEKNRFERVFGQMGIDSNWILTAESKPEEIDSALTKFAEVASKAASASADEFPFLLESGWKSVQ